MRIAINLDVMFDDTKLIKENLILLKQLKNSGNNIYIILPNTENSKNLLGYKKDVLILQSCLKMNNIKVDKIISEEDAKKENIELNIEKKNREGKSIIELSKTGMNIVKDVSNYNKIYDEVTKLRYSYYDEIKPLSGVPSIDKKFMGYYSYNQKNVKKVDQTIYEYLYNINKNNMNNEALDYFGKKMTFKQLFKEIEKCAKSYISAGVTKGDSVIICMPNTPEGVIAFYATSMIGAVANMVHPLSSENELLDYITESNSKYIIALDSCYDKINNISKDINIKKTIYVSPSNSMPTIMKHGYDILNRKKKSKITENNKIVTWNNFIREGKLMKNIEIAKNNKEKTAVVLHTGGTTGNSKGVMLTNDNFNNSIEQLRVVVPSFSDGDKLLAITPIFHGFGLSDCIHAPLCLNMSVVLLPQFELKLFVKTLLRTKANLILGVPTLWRAMINTDLLKNKDLSFLKVLISGGDTLPVQLENEINGFLKAHNAPNKVFKGYGLTESLAAVIFSHEAANDKTTIGIPVPGNNVKIVIPGTIDEVPENTEGEICINGPTVSKGYYNNQEETDEILKKHEDGKTWLHTGDMGYVDDKGKVFYTQRLKRIIISSGYNVYPSQIEDVILKHNMIEQCVVVGIPHAYKMNVPKAYVVIKRGYENQRVKITNEIKELCRINLSKFSIPKDIEFRTELPKSKMGKVDYKALERENLTDENIEIEKTR